MRGRGTMQGLWTAVQARARDERGVAMAEYLPLLAVIGLVVMFSLTEPGFATPWRRGSSASASSHSWT